MRGGTLDPNSMLKFEARLRVYMKLSMTGGGDGGAPHIRRVVMRGTIKLFDRIRATNIDRKLYITSSRPI